MARPGDGPDHLHHVAAGVLDVVERFFQAVGPGVGVVVGVTLTQHDAVDDTCGHALRRQAVLVVHEALVQPRQRACENGLRLSRGRRARRGRALAMDRHDPPLLVVGIQLTGVVKNRPVPVQVIRRGCSPPQRVVRELGKDVTRRRVARPDLDKLMTFSLPEFRPAANTGRRGWPVRDRSSSPRSMPGRTR